VKFLVKYKLFENLQQAEKIEKTIPKDKLDKWLEVKKWALENNYDEYLGWISLRNGEGKSHVAPYEFNIPFLKEVIDKIKEFKIDVYSPEYKKYSLLDWSQHVNDI